MTTENKDNRLNDSVKAGTPIREAINTEMMGSRANMSFEAIAESRLSALMIDEHTMANSSPLTTEQYEARKAQLMAAASSTGWPLDIQTVNTLDRVMATFDAIWREIWVKFPQEIAFDPSWENGTGYFDGAISVSVDGYATSVDPIGRRLIFAPSNIPGRKVVLFDRNATGPRVAAHVPTRPENDRVGGRVICAYEADEIDPGLTALVAAYNGL